MDFNIFMNIHSIEVMDIIRGSRINISKFYTVHLDYAPQH
jgi:hypothetical protein